LKAVLLDQPTGDGSARPVEFRRTVGGLAEHHEPGVAEPVEIGAKVLLFGRRQMIPRLAQEIDELAVGSLANLLGCR
jgi:hypothetical protein